MAGGKPMIWANDIPEVAAPPEKPRPDAEAVFIRPNNPIYVRDKKPVKYQPCWILNKDGQHVIMDCYNRRNDGSLRFNANCTLTCKFSQSE